MTGWAADEEVAARYAKYETWTFWVGYGLYLTKRLASHSTNCAAAWATTGRSGIMGLSRVGCKTEIANRLLTGDPETVDTIKYMETVCD